ncbi:hypothetical protein LCGC14_0680360 [marine sediment metagenome]|uniref:Uncharacterized protein n=1 Tax=marine sediment metagenome TaxID=412755 RepID=A0A0F9TWF4_9ZZZZ
MSEEIGEYIYLLWEDEPLFELVKGHVSHLEAIDAMVRDGIGVSGQNWRSRHTYGRWIPDSTGEYDLRFHLSGPGRGAFPVTILDRER